MLLICSYVTHKTYMNCDMGGVLQKGYWGPKVWFLGYVKLLGVHGPFHPPYRAPMNSESISIMHAIELCSFFVLKFTNFQGSKHFLMYLMLHYSY